MLINVSVLGDKKVFVCSSQGAACPEPSTVFVDLRALRNDRVTLVEKGSPHSLCLMESGKVGRDLLSYYQELECIFVNIPIKEINLLTSS